MTTRIFILLLLFTSLLLVPKFSTGHRGTMSAPLTLGQVSFVEKEGPPTYLVPIGPEPPSEPSNGPLFSEHGPLLEPVHHPASFSIESEIQDVCMVYEAPPPESIWVVVRELYVKLTRLLCERFAWATHYFCSPVTPVDHSSVDEDTDTYPATLTPPAETQEEEQREVEAPKEEVVEEVVEEGEEEVEEIQESSLPSTDSYTWDLSLPSNSSVCDVFLAVNTSSSLTDATLGSSTSNI